MKILGSLGGNSDTIACMACGIAACMYPIPVEIEKVCNEILTEDLKMIQEEFIKKIN